MQEHMLRMQTGEKHKQWVRGHYLVHYNTSNLQSSEKKQKKVGMRQWMHGIEIMQNMISWTKTIITISNKFV